MPSPVEVSHGDVRVHVDDDTHSLYTIDAQHAQIHLGNVYSVSHIFATVADNGNADVTLTTPATGTIYMVGNVNAGGDAYIYIYEEPTTSANGTGLTPVNHNRRSSNTSDCAAYYGPTVTGTGTELRQKYAPGGSGNKTVGASEPTYQEYILAASTRYLVRVTNHAGQAKDISISLTWVEL